MAIRADRVGVRQDQVDVHGRVTSPSFLNELLEDLPEWTDMPVWVNGTEELLPSNNSVPVTSPILADIAYPDIRRDNQYFTYRESPTSVDGLAKIKSIKGNTLVWNQLVNVNVASNFITFSDSIIKLTGTPTGTINLMSNQITHDSTHKYLFLQETLANPNNITFSIGMSSGFPWVSDAGTVGSHSSMYQSNYNTRLGLYNIANKDLTGIEMTCSIFDLSRIFGIGNEPTTIEEFTSLFNLPYYDYNAGTLLSFNGTGLKTVGKNQFNKNTVVHQHFINGNNISAQNPDLAHSDYISVLANTVYCSNIPNIAGVNKIAFYDIGKNLISFGDKVPTQWTTPSNCAFVRINMREEDVDSVYFNIGTDTTYEPYTSSTLSLPISTYFPTGMKSAGTLYDELTPTKATIRLIKTTLDGTNVIANYYGAYLEHQLFYVDLFDATYVDYSNMPNLISNHYSTSATIEMGDKCIRYQAVENRPNIGRIYWTDDRYSSADAMNTALQSDPLEIISLAQTPVELPTMSFE